MKILEDIRNAFRNLKEFILLVTGLGDQPEPEQDVAQMHQEVEEEPSLEDILSRSQVTATGDEPQSILSFIVTSNGNIDMNISWNDEDDITAQNLASVLYLTNSGAFETNCANLLLAMAQENPKNMKFVRKIIENWNEQKAAEPLVKPSEVFQFGTVGTKE